MKRLSICYDVLTEAYKEWLVRFLESTPVDELCARIYSHLSCFTTYVDRDSHVYLEGNCTMEGTVVSLVQDVPVDAVCTGPAFMKPTTVGALNVTVEDIESSSNTYVTSDGVYLIPVIGDFIEAPSDTYTIGTIPIEFIKEVEEYVKN